MENEEMLKFINFNKGSGVQFSTMLSSLDFGSNSQTTNDYSYPEESNLEESTKTNEKSNMFGELPEINFGEIKAKVSPITPPEIEEDEGVEDIDFSKFDTNQFKVKEKQPTLTNKYNGVYNGKESVLINKYAKKYNVDPLLVASVIQQESGFKHNVTSGAGAIGIMQLMKPTAKDLKVDPYDKEQNIDGGVRYLSQMLKKFGNVKDALYAYNAGPGTLQKFKEGKRKTLPTETINYFKSINANYKKFTGNNL